MPQLMVRSVSVAVLAMLLFAPTLTAAASRLVGDVPRPGDKPLESLPGVDTEYGVLRTNDGTLLRTIVTRPQGRSGRLPAVIFVQWLSCDPLALPATGGDGWAAMLRRIVREPGALVWRTEKRGVGGSEGRCDTLDYETELADHRTALAVLKQRPDVDPRRIVIFGGSMGANYASLVAQDQEVAGVMVWGGGALTWAERMLAFERNALELRGTPPSELAREMTLRYRFFDRYLNDGQTPMQIAAQHPDLGAVWTRIIGASATGHYGRPFAFHQQAQRQNWAGAWSRIEAPVLILYGEMDWFEEPRGAELIGRILNARRPGSARVVGVPGLDHHFTRFTTREAAFRDEGGRIDADAAVNVMLPWLQERLFPERAR